MGRRTGCTGGTSGLDAHGDQFLSWGSVLFWKYLFIFPVFHSHREQKVLCSLSFARNTFCLHWGAVITSHASQLLAWCPHGSGGNFSLSLHAELSKSSSGTFPPFWEHQGLAVPKNKMLQHAVGIQGSRENIFLHTLWLYAVLPGTG